MPNRSAESDQYNPAINFVGQGGGAMSEQIKSFNWLKTPLGRQENWPASLKTVLRVILESPFPMAIIWGNSYTQLYNDAYKNILGDERHKETFGASVKTSLAEYWSVLEPMFLQVFNGKPVVQTNFPANRPKDKNADIRYFDFSYTPIKAEDDTVEGILITAIETTQRLQALTELEEREKQLKFAVEAAELGTWDLNPVTNKFRGNDRLKSWFGLGPDDEIELPKAIAVIADKDRDRVIKAITSALDYSSGGNYDIIYSIIHPETNKERIVHAKGRATFAADNQPVRFDGTLQDVTAEILSRHAIAEREERLSVAIAGAGLGTYDYRPLTGELHWSATAKQMFGLPSEAEVDFDLFLKAIHPDDREKAQQNINQAAQTGNNGIYENEYRTIGITDGKLRWVRSKGKVIFDESGIAIRFTGITQDITVQKLAEQEVLTANERFRLINKATQDAIWDWDLKNNQLHWNEAVEVVFGYKPYEVKPTIEWWNDNLHPEDRDRVVHGRKAVIDSGGTGWTDEYRFRCRNGSYKTVFDRGFVLHDESGQASRMLGSMQDFTHRIEAEQALKQSEERFEAAVAAVAGIIWTNTPDGKMEGVQPGWSELTGQSPEQYQGYGWARVVHEEDAEATVSAWNEAVKDRRPFVFEHRLKKADGNWGHFSIRAIPILTTDGNIREWVGVHTEITESKKAEQALLESEQRFRFLADKLPQMFWMQHVNGEIEYASSMFREYSGIENSSEAWQHMVHPDERESLLQSWDEHLHTQKSFRHEVRLRNKEGIYRWHLSIAEPIKDNDGKAIRWIGVLTDVHIQKTFAEELRKQVADRTNELEQKNIELERSKSFLQQLLDSSVEYISVLDRDMRFVMVNKRYEETLGIAQSEFKGKVIYDINSQIKESPTVDAIRRALSGEMVHLEKRPATSRPDIFIDTYFVPWRIGSTVEGVVVMSRDVTNIVHTERLLEQRNADLATTQIFLKTVLDSSVELVLALDKDLRFTFVNKEYEKFTGLRMEDVQGRSIEDVHTGVANTEFYQQLKEVLGGKALVKDVRESFTKEGVIFESYVLPLKTGDEIVGVVSLQRDITQIMHLTESLKVANKELQRSNEDLMQFAHVASHDLREPLRKIRVFADLLKDEAGTALTPTATAYLQKIDKASERMADMIEGVLLYSAADSAKQMDEAIDLNLILHNVQHDLEVVIHQKKAEVNVSHLPVVKGSRVLLQQLFYNLVNNALKFSKADNTSRIFISASEDAECYLIAVADNGIGFPPEHNEIIFRTFTRLHSKDVYEGTGLGLALCKKIVERHGGTISAEGKQGVGATFHIRLPK